MLKFLGFLASAVMAYFNYSSGKMDKFEVRTFVSLNKNLRKANNYAEKYIFENEGNKRKNKLEKYKKLFFKYN